RASRPGAVRRRRRRHARRRRGWTARSSSARARVHGWGLGSHVSRPARRRRRGRPREQEPLRGDSSATTLEPSPPTESVNPASGRVLRRLRALAAPLARLLAAPLLHPLAPALAPPTQLAPSFGRHAGHV